MLARLRMRPGRRLQRFIDRRAQVRTRPFSLAAGRIYILPTRNGLYFAVLVFVMLLGSMNYSNSLGFALTFLLAAVGLVAMHHTQRNLLRLQIRGVSAAAVFAGENASFQLELANDTRLGRHAIRVAAKGMATCTIDLPAGSRGHAYIRCPTRHRGYLDCPRLRIDSEYPMGLFNAWRWLAVDASVLVYPRPAGIHTLPPENAHGAEGPRALSRGDTEFIGHRAYVSGDSPRRIDWKASARTDALIVSKHADTRERQLWLDAAALGHLDNEARLSQLTRWVLAADTAGLRYGLRLPGQRRAQALAPNTGSAHKRACLTALALY